MQNGTTLDAASRAALIEKTLDLLQKYYVFPEVAATIATAVGQRLTSGEYDAITTRLELRDVLTEQMQAISNDRHLRLIHHVEELPPYENAYEDEGWLEEERQTGLLKNFGFQRAERLAGNIGYIQHNGYFYDPSYAGETVVAIMQLLAHTSALIIDVRGNRGGESSMVALICSYLLPAKATHLNDFYTRDTDSIEQSWTLGYVPGKRYDTNPVYILTSGKTFSAAEELAYNLKHLKRATIVGEATRGGAHPREQYQLDKHLELALPNSRAINPITKANWEAVGVAPDIAVAENLAFNVAYEHALKQLLEKVTAADAGWLQSLQEEVETALAALDQERAKE